jgi:hypothetical protein
MGKYYGAIGFFATEETAPSVWQEHITERFYYGDVLQFNRSMVSSDKVNDDININNKISIVADPFAYENCSTMRYISWMGAKWKITNVEPLYPRMILTIGGLYNE